MMIAPSLPPIQVPRAIPAAMTRACSSHTIVISCPEERPTVRSSAKLELAVAEGYVGVYEESDAAQLLRTEPNAMNSSERQPALTRGSTLDSARRWLRSSTAEAGEPAHVLDLLDHHRGCPVPLPSRPRWRPGSGSLEPMLACRLRLVRSTTRKRSFGVVMVGKSSTVSCTRTGTLYPATLTSNSSPMAWPESRMNDLLARAGDGFPAGSVEDAPRRQGPPAAPGEQGGPRVAVEHDAGLSQHVGHCVGVGLQDAPPSGVVEGLDDDGLAAVCIYGNLVYDDGACLEPPLRVGLLDPEGRRVLMVGWAIRWSGPLS